MNSETPRKKLTSRQLLLALIGGALSALVCLTLAIFLLRPPALPQITQQRLDSAAAMWKDAAIENYDLTVVLEGRAASEYIVEARDGKVKNAWRRNLADPNTATVPLRHDHALETWSVATMLRVIQKDLDSIAKAKQGDIDACNLELRGTFQASGLPTRFRRVEWGSNIDSGWEVTRFEIIK